MSEQKIQLVCPAGNFPSLRAALEHGADAVYIGFRDGTNARNFPGLNFTLADAQRALDYAHRLGRSVYLAINTYPKPERWQAHTDAIDRAVDLGVDVLILADVGLLEYVSQRYPQQRIHLSVQGSATNLAAIEFYHQHFGVQRVVLPRVLSLAQVRAIIARSPVPIEVFGFGSLCVMVEGRCALSSYVTGDSPNLAGVCSPAHAVRWEEGRGGKQSRLNGVLIDRYPVGAAAGYPTLCKGRFQVGKQLYYTFEEPVSLNVLEWLPELVRMGAVALKIEGRQRSPAYVAQVTQIMRSAIDHYYANPGSFAVQQQWITGLHRISEGQTNTLGAFQRSWQ